MKRRRLFGLIPLTAIILLSTIFGVCAYALQEEPVFEHITSMEGLSHDTVYSIVQDKAGYMWFGTEDGLNKYDGYEIEVYRGGNTEELIGNANCAVLFVDDDNAIWIASWGGGIEVLDQENGTVKSYVNNPSDPESISDNSVHSIFQDSRGTLWFGTYTQGLNRFDSKAGKFKTYTHSDSDSNSISDNRVWWISEDADGSLLLGTNTGLDKFNPDTEQFTHYTQIENRVRTMYWDQKNDLWLGTQKGLCKFDPDSGQYQYYLHDSDDPSMEVITSIYEDSNEDFWVGSSNGINVFDPEAGAFTRYENEPEHGDSISNNDVRVIFEDQSANLWIGTRGGGVNKLDIKPKKFQSFNNLENEKITLSDVNVFSIFQGSDEVIWVGTNNGGLNRFDLKNKTQEYLMSDITKEENRDISAITEDENSLWVGSLGGLNRIDKDTNKIITYKNDSEKSGTISHNTVLSLLRDSRNAIWVGTLGGLNKYDRNRDQFVSYLSDSEDSTSISSDIVNCIYEDGVKNLWVGTQSGFNQLDSKTGIFTRFLYNKDNENGISDNIIQCIFEDSLQNLWIGTQYGLNRYDRETGLFTSYTTEDGLPNNNINGIQEDADGRLWISTNKGVSYFDVTGKQFTNYDAFDGLQGNGYNHGAYETTKTGEILFGGTKGLDFIDPDNFAKNTFQPQIVITGFRVMEKDYDFTKALKENREVSLPYNENNIWVEFSSLDFTLTERNQYAYMLEGFDDDWIYSGTENTLNYTNIPHGNYVLRIKGSNSDGVWSEKVVALNIHISPPWWLSAVAIIAYAFSLAAAVLMGIRYMTRRHERRNEVLNKRLQSTIRVLSKVGAMRDMYTAGHQKRVQQLSCEIASEMKLSAETINNIYLGSLIHDIGKINIASEFLNKPGKLTDLEFRILQEHVKFGYEIIQEINFPDQVSAIISQHHERLDGTGYPEGIRGDQIDIASRIIAVADVVEAMSSDRPYRPALGIEVALEEIDKYKGIRFDVNVVEACLKLFREKDFRFTI